MSIILRLTFIFVTLLSLVIMTNILRKARMSKSDAVNWIVLSFVLIFFALFPKPLIFFFSLIGIQIPANGVFAGFIFLIFIILFYHNIRLSTLKIKQKEIIQQLSLFENEFKSNGKKK